MSHTFTKADESFMAIALEEARRAGADGDVPVGAVLIRTSTGEILSRGRNTREVMRTALGHAEMNTISEACAALNSWRLEDCTLYVTLEPCPMCAGAILHARIPRIVCGAMDPVAGAMGSVWALHRHPVESKHTRLESGCLEEACGEILREFFRSRREE
jgi:tRNA(adenine34) deaminase